MASNRNTMLKILALLSREEVVLSVRLQLNRDLSTLAAKLSSPLIIDSAKPEKLKIVAIRHRIPLCPVNNRQVNRINCSNSRRKARLEASSMEDILMVTHTTVTRTMPHSRINSK